MYNNIQALGELRYYDFFKWVKAEERAIKVAQR